MYLINSRRLPCQDARLSMFISRGECHLIPQFPPRLLLCLRRQGGSADSRDPVSSSCMVTSQAKNGNELGFEVQDSSGIQDLNLNTEPRAAEGCRLISQLLTAELTVQVLARSVWLCICRRVCRAPPQLNPKLQASSTVPQLILSAASLLWLR